MGKHFFCVKNSVIPIHLRTKIFDSYITPVLIYGAHMDKIQYGWNKANIKSDKGIIAGFLHKEK